MANCRKAAEYLAQAFLLSDKLKNVQDVGAPKSPKRNEVQTDAESLSVYLGYAFDAIGRPPFEGYEHAKTNLMRQIESEYPVEYYVRRYAEDLQRQILEQGLLDIIYCQCGDRPKGSTDG